MKSSRSLSHLTDGGAAGGVACLDEPLDFPFLSFLVLGSCTEGTNIMCWKPWFWGHEIIHIKIPTARQGAAGAGRPAKV